MSELAEIRSRISAHQRTEARATADVEISSARIKESRKTLAEDYGVTSRSQYEQKVAELKKEAEDALADLEASLSASGEGQ